MDRSHPAHTAAGWLVLSIDLRPKLQIKLPDDNCWYMTRTGEPAAIPVLRCIDILTSIAGHDFEACHARAHAHPVDGSNVLFLCRDDVQSVSPAK